MDDWKERWCFYFRKGNAAEAVQELRKRFPKGQRFTLVINKSGNWAEPHITRLGLQIKDIVLMLDPEEGVSARIIILCVDGTKLTFDTKIEEESQLNQLDPYGTPFLRMFEYWLCWDGKGTRTGHPTPTPDLGPSTLEEGIYAWCMIPDGVVPYVPPDETWTAFLTSGNGVAVYNRLQRYFEGNRFAVSYTVGDTEIPLLHGVHRLDALELIPGPDQKDPWVTIALRLSGKHTFFNIVSVPTQVGEDTPTTTVPPFFNARGDQLTITWQGETHKAECLSFIPVPPI